MKIKILSICFSLIYLLSSCEDFSEEYGFFMDFESEISVKSVSATQDGYTVELLCPFEIKAGNPDIKEVGVSYTISDENYKVKGEYQDNCIEVTLSNLPYGRTVRIVPYLSAAEGEVKSRYTQEIKYEKKDFMPYATSYLLSMPSIGKLRLEVDCTVKDSRYPLTNAVASFNGISNNASISQNGISVDFNLADMDKSSDSNISFSLSNALGTTTWTVPMTVTTAIATAHYADDGCYDDYIRLCGVDWAKGNLLYDDGVWRIASRQDESFLESGKSIVSTTQIEHFSFGETNAQIHKDRHEYWYTNAFELRSSCCIQGNPASDVVAANLSGGWVMPLKTDLDKLAKTASWQYGYTECNGKIVYGILFYTASEKLMRSFTTVRFDSEKLDDMGLFLPALGFLRTSGNAVNDKNVYYMSADADKWEAVIMYPFSYYGTIYHLEQNDNDIVVTDESLSEYSSAFSFSFQYPIRPIKGLVKEDIYERNLSVTEGEVIDLGLSVKWASCNAGALSPEEKGNISNLSNPSTGGFDNRIWRTPTRAEMQELIESCEWTWGQYNGVNGYQVTGPNGNSIFLPAQNVENQVGMYFAGSELFDDRHVYILGISSQNYVINDYMTYNISSFRSATLCIRNVALE